VVLCEAVAAAGTPARLWRDRARVVAAHPQLRAAQAAAQAAVEAELARAVADRLGTAAPGNYPHVVVVAALAVTRAALEQSAAEGEDALRRALDDSFAALARGLEPPWS
jgi:hypothetical protein